MSCLSSFLVLTLLLLIKLWQKIGRGIWSGTTSGFFPKNWGFPTCMGPYPLHTSVYIGVKYGWVGVAEVLVSGPCEVLKFLKFLKFHSADLCETDASEQCVAF